MVTSYVNIFWSRRKSAALVCLLRCLKGKKHAGSTDVLVALIGYSKMHWFLEATSESRRGWGGKKGNFFSIRTVWDSVPLLWIGSIWSSYPCCQYKANVKILVCLSLLKFWECILKQLNTNAAYPAAVKPCPWSKHLVVGLWLPSHQKRTKGLCNFCIHHSVVVQIRNA